MLWVQHPSDSARPPQCISRDKSAPLHHPVLVTASQLAEVSASRSTCCGGGDPEPDWLLAAKQSANREAVTGAECGGGVGVCIECFLALF